MSTDPAREDLERPWWTDAVVYEVYLRSFADSDGDGVGDLAGITSRLDHLAALGVDALWVTPFFPSPGHDHGYDVSDFTAVDPVLGDLAAFDDLVRAAHERGLRVLVDVVPNHTSDQHPWFRAALAEGRDGGRHRDYYLWRDPAPDGGPPNNWRSNFGGPAWTLDPASGQYYHHAYLPEQPDLNWRNDAVHAEWLRILTYWIGRGVDGFRIDVAHNLLKHADFLDNPPAAEAVRGAVPVGRAREARGLARLYDVDQDDVVEIYRRLRTELPGTAAGAPAFLLGETVLEDPERVLRYVEPGRLDSAMWFGTDAAGFDVDDLARALRVSAPPVGGVVGWFLSNHDRSRPATRLAPQPAAEDDGGRGADRALAVGAVVLAMPGPYLLYQGEELGAVDLPVDAAASRDPIAVRAGEADMSRDRARAPMPWNDEPGRGFTTGEPWLPPGPLPPAGAAATQALDDGSHLNRWRALLTSWREVRGELPREVGVAAADGVLSVSRGSLRVVLNLSAEPVAMGEHARAGARILWRSLSGEAGHIRPEEVVWIQDEHQATAR